MLPDMPKDFAADLSACNLENLGFLTKPSTQSGMRPINAELKEENGFLSVKRFLFDGGWEDLEPTEPFAVQKAVRVESDVSYYEELVGAVGDENDAS